MSKVLRHERLRQLLDYDPSTGWFIRLVSRGNSKAGSRAGHLALNGYRIVMIDGESYYEHRLAWFFTHGSFPKEEIDHMNHVRDDNRIENLRIVNRQINNQNMSKRADNSSGAIGVVWYKRDRTWQAQIAVDGKPIYLGRYEDKQDAIKARLEAEERYGFHPNHGKV